MLPRTIRIMEKLKDGQNRHNTPSSSSRQRDEDILQLLSIPNYESTKGLSELDKIKAMKGSSTGLLNKIVSTPLIYHNSTNDINLDDLPIRDETEEFLLKNKCNNSTKVSSFDNKNVSVTSQKSPNDYDSKKNPNYLPSAEELYFEIECNENSRDSCISQNVSVSPDLSLIAYNYNEDPDYLPSGDETESSSLNNTCGSEESSGALSFPPKNTCTQKNLESSPMQTNFENVQGHLLPEDECDENDLTSKSLKKYEHSKTPTITSSSVSVPRSSNDKGPEKKRRTRNKVFCIYCESSIDNFARHLARNHPAETEVQKFLAMKKNNAERKQIIAKLRKQGNYLLNINDCVRPVKKPDVALVTDCQPCEYCLGFYSRKSLWRHKKRCPQNTNKNDLTPNKNILFPFKIDQELIVKVFPRMRPDKVSVAAKKDALICAFGSRYLKCHRDKHFITVTSRKMRELSKLLIEIKTLESKVTNLFEALRPQYYDTILHATKNISQYCEVNNTFSSPTFALNIKKSLKDCCNIAINFALKEKHVYHSQTAAESEADLKTTILLLDNNWLYDISKQASNDINMKKWNKLTIIPLASDLKIFKDYLLQKGKEAVTELESNPQNSKAYLDLLETVYCRVLLLNRRRPGELERMHLNTYLRYEKSSNYEEFSDVVTASEKILMKRFRRVVIRGKRGRGVPVLFSNDVQDHLELLHKSRPHVFGTIENPYLFGKPFYQTPIVGYKTLQKLALSSGAKNPTALTATRLRKHLATITQIFNMSESDIEQLATFMGHTDHIHRGEYRLPDDVFQTAKICKLLLAMEEGKAADWKGKKLDEINLDMDENLLDGNSDKEEVAELAKEYYDISQDSGKDDGENVFSESRPKISFKKKRVLIPWSPDQKKIVNDFFKMHIKNKIPPKKNECELLISKNKELLKNKNWLKIKVFVQNIYTKLP